MSKGNALTTGFYSHLKEKSGHDDQLAACVDRVVNKLVATSTSGDRPGMLLGKIQSGKTRGFIGTIARAFDEGFEIAIVLTKGTKTLSEQTVARLKTDFQDFIEQDKVLVLDIMSMPGDLLRSELRRKLVVVAKKENKNLQKLKAFIVDKKLTDKRLLIVDDEADLASVRFVKEKGSDDIGQGAIATMMDELRTMMKDVAMLQVTATPYSLYLQPDDYPSAGYVFKPKRPAFTEILPTHDKYVGGDFFFGDFEDDDYRSQLYVEVSTVEQDALRKADKRRIKEGNVIGNPLTHSLCRAVIGFVMGAAIRRWQQQDVGETPQKYAMIVHNDVKKNAQKWQAEVVGWILKDTAALSKGNAVVSTLLGEIYDDFERSVTSQSGKMPDRDTAYDLVFTAITEDEIVLEEVNSDKDVVSLLDAKRELHLRTGFNIFVGGNILDRGITIPKLLAFYYGRNPKTMQADTVLQHSRMYGSRHPQDLLVTRFYTSNAVYSRLNAINELEKTLRRAFLEGAHDQGVVFISSDSNGGIRPCAPNKTLLSDMVSIDTGETLLPSNFDVRAKASGDLAKIDKLILPQWDGAYTQIEPEKAYEVLDLISRTLEPMGEQFDWEAFPSLIKYYLDAESADPSLPKRKLLVTSARGRELDRENSGRKRGKSIMGPRMRDDVFAHASTDPILVLIQQKGGRERGWRASNFWWPLLVPPTNSTPCVFASKSAV